MQPTTAFEEGDEGFGVRRRSEIPLALAFLVPSLLVFGVFLFYPMVRTFQLGFYESDPFGTGQRYVGFEQYVDVLTSSDFHHSLLVTLAFTLLTGGFGLLIGLGLAVLAHQRLRGITVYRTIFSSTVATSVAVSSLIWLVLLNPSIGVVNQVLESIGRDPVSWTRDPDTALFAVSATTIWQNLGITFIVMIAGLQSIPDDLYESARVDGASAWMQFRHVTVPMLSPTLLLASVILTINAFQSFGQIDLLTQGGPDESTNVIVYSIFDALQNNNSGVAAAQAVVLFLIVLVLTLVQFRFFEQRVHYAGGEA